MAASLEDGAGIAPNAALAFEWYARGARLRNADCLLALGNACLHGHAQGGIERDEARAAELFATGVEIDSPACIRALAACYVRGAGVAPSVQRVRCRVFLHVITCGKIDSDVCSRFRTVVSLAGKQALTLLEIGADIDEACAREFATLRDANLAVFKSIFGGAGE